MTDDNSTPQSPNGQAASSGAPVTDLVAHRRRRDVLHSITVVFGGVHYGTITIDAPYATGTPMSLYVVPARGDLDGDEPSGPLDCLITDDAGLALRHHAAQ